MLTFATLGPSGSNHELVTRAYLELHGLSNARIVFVDDFDQALELMVEGAVQHVVQAAVHPQATSTVAKACLRHRIFVIDTFISPSHPLAVLTRVEVVTPQSLGLQPATKDYVDTDRWPTLVPEGSTVAVGEGLLAGRYDSGLTLLALADRYPGRFRVDEIIGSVDDPWLVFGRQRTTGGRLLAWPDSPAARLYAREDG